MAELNTLIVGDIITIPRDQYGHPVVKLDPKTRQPTGELQRFRVVHVDETGAKLEPVPE
jgi:hypothetical protein